MYNKSPTKADKIHVLVSVFPADTASIFVDEKLRAVRLEASKLGKTECELIVI